MIVQGSWDTRKEQQQQQQKQQLFGWEFGGKRTALILKSCISSTTEFMFLIIIPQIPRIFTWYSQCFLFLKNKADLCGKIILIEERAFPQTSY